MLGSITPSGSRAVNAGNSLTLITLVRKEFLVFELTAHSPLKEHSRYPKPTPREYLYRCRIPDERKLKRTVKKLQPPPRSGGYPRTSASPHARVPMVGGGISFRAVPKTNLERDAFVSENRRFLYALTSYELRVLLLFGLGLGGRC